MPLEYLYNRSLRAALAIGCLLLAGCVNFRQELLHGSAPLEISVRIDTNHPCGAFDPHTAFGAGVDGHWQGETKELLSPANIRQMLSAGLGPVSVRLRTELAVEAWHWNPKGSWSDAAHQQGYWTSDFNPSTPIQVSYGYKLPRRGDTLDEANDDGFSMLDDGNPDTFWKSNPYVAWAFSGEPDSAHPQWVILDFGKPVCLDTIRISWAEPYATKFKVEYALGGRAYFGGHPWGVWKSFPWGAISNGKGGIQELRLASHPLKVRYLRLWLTEGSGTAPHGSTDLRDHLGYAIREISAGTTEQKGVFLDQVTHAPDHHQTTAYASSTDPWHRVIDRDPHVEQPGIDLIARCGITRGLPLMLAVPVLYDTPENAAALAHYVKKRNIAISRYELGEEPDGQRVAPEDFGALYAQVARAMARVLPERALLGGPSFVTVDIDPKDDTYRCDHRPWIERFRKELSRQGESGDLQFLSFEWYPFDDVEGKESEQLPRSYKMMKQAMERLLPLGLPLVIGEANYSVFPCQQEVDLGGALLNAEMPAQFLTSGGAAFYYYSYEPNKLEESSESWGNQMMLLEGKHGATPLATYHAMKLLTQKWMNLKGGVHQAYRVKTNIPLAQQKLMSLFALQRPDHTWSLLVINKDAGHSCRLSLPGKEFNGSCHLSTYSAKQYQWRADGSNGHPLRNSPHQEGRVSARKPITIPPWSLTVLTSEEAN